MIEKRSDDSLPALERTLRIGATGFQHIASAVIVLEGGDPAHKARFTSSSVAEDRVRRTHECDAAPDAISAFKAGRSTTGGLRTRAILEGRPGNLRY